MKNSKFLFFCLKKHEFGNVFLEIFESFELKNRKFVSRKIEIVHQKTRKIVFRKIEIFDQKNENSFLEKPTFLEILEKSKFCLKKPYF